MSSLFGLLGGLANPTAAPNAALASPSDTSASRALIQPGPQSGDSEMLRVRTARDLQ